MDSGTLTPLLKRLKEKGYVTRRRSTEDERDLIVTITDSGEALKERVVTVPERLGACVALDPQRVQTLYELLYEVIGKLTQQDCEKELYLDCKLIKRQPPGHSNRARRLL